MPYLPHLTSIAISSRTKFLVALSLSKERFKESSQASVKPCRNQVREACENVFSTLQVKASVSSFYKAKQMSQLFLQYVVLNKKLVVTSALLVVTRSY